MKLNNIIILIFATTLIGCGINKTLIKKNSWLDGNWMGIGYQIDIKEDNKWLIQLEIDADKRIYNITYPSLNCSGKWKLIKYSNDQATFEEVIENNTINCIDKGTIILSKIDTERIIFAYFYNEEIDDDKIAYAYSTLERK